MLKKLIHTEKDVSLTVLRVILGIIFFAHGSQKALGWFGGNGFAATMNAFTTMMHIPSILAFLAIMAEFLGGLGLVVGLLTRIAAFGILCNMVVAIALVHYKYGLFMNWLGQQKGEGFEYHLLAIAIAFAIVLKGAGALSIDRTISTSLPNRP